jgi:hypothetical protein
MFSRDENAYGIAITAVRRPGTHHLSILGIFTYARWHHRTIAPLTAIDYELLSDFSG